jgi:hypothetical protein
MARALLLTEEARALARDLIAKAAAEPTKWEDAKRLAENKKRGQDTYILNEKFTIVIPQGYIVTYTHEHQRPDLICRHISISAEGALPNKGPHPAAVVEIIKMFGFINGLGEMPAWISKKKDGSLIVEMLEPLDGDLNHLIGGYNAV